MPTRLCMPWPLSTAAFRRPMRSVAVSVWTDDGVKFHWQLEGTNSKGGTELRRSGGDEIV
jgi:hypothetical protein